MSQSPRRGVSNALFAAAALLPACAGPAETDNKPAPEVAAVTPSSRAWARNSLASMAPAPAAPRHPIDQTPAAKDRPDKKTVKAGKTDTGTRDIVRATTAAQRAPVVKNKNDAEQGLGKGSGLYVYLLPEPRGDIDVLERLKNFYGCIDRAGAAGSHKKIVLLLPAAQETSTTATITEPSDKSGLSPLGGGDPNLTLLATNALLPFPRCGW